MDIHCIIVDDERLARLELAALLEEIGGCKVIGQAANAKAAVPMIESLRPDLLFLDINMPIMDGWEFLAEFLKIRFPEKVIINVITSSIDPADYQKWNEFRLNCYHYLNFKNKPLFKIEPTDLSRINLAS